MRHARSKVTLSALAVVGLVVTLTALTSPVDAATSRTFAFKGFTWSQSLHSKVGVNSQAWNRKQNVVPRDGSLYVKTARYCTPDGAEPAADEKAHAGTCGDIANTTYATGRVQVGGLTLARDFSVAFTADLPGTVDPGSRMALWMVHGPYCDDNPATPEPTANPALAELDLLEWYSRKPGKSYSTTHLACDATRAPALLSDANKLDLPNRRGTHTWKVERHGPVIRYYRDGVQLGSKHVCGDGALTSTQNPPTCGAALRGPYTLIIQGEVFANECGADCPVISGPNDYDRFETQVMRVRNVKVTGRS